MIVLDGVTLLVVGSGAVLTWALMFISSANIASSIDAARAELSQMNMWREKAVKAELELEGARSAQDYYSRLARDRGNKIDELNLKLNCPKKGKK